jgi:hypothetical protein
MVSAASVRSPRATHGSPPGTPLVATKPTTRAPRGERRCALSAAGGALAQPGRGGCSERARRADRGSRRAILPALLAGSLVAVVSFAPRTAGATAGFPAEIRFDLNAPSVPGCTLCHATTAGGGSVTQPFGQAMIARGLRPGDSASLTTAMQALEAEGTDSDGDGLGDIEELRQGLDPNNPNDAGTTPPVYGCGAEVVRHPPSAWGSVILGLGLAFTWARRRAKSGRASR